MKFVITNLKVGETLKGQVTEHLPGHELLIGFQGDLLRVVNETGRSFSVGDPVWLIVRAINPIRFQLLDRREQRRRGRIDVSV